MTVPTSVFINYRQDDTAGFAEYLRICLEEQLPRGSVFLDTESISYGEVIGDVIGQHLEQTKLLLVVVGENWQDVTDAEGDRRLLNPNDWVRKEIEFAAEKDKTIILVLFNQVDFKKTGDWLSRKVSSIGFLSEKKYFPCDEKNLRRDVEALINYLRTLPELPFLPEGGEKVTDSPLPSLRDELAREFPLPKKYHLPHSKVPFMALNYFRPEDARIFFGRTEESLRLCRAVSNFPVVLLYGQSGAGKSSLLNAGLLPRIEDRFVSHYLRRDKEPGLHRQLQNWLDTYCESGKPTLLILDQVEEMFTNPRENRKEEPSATADLLGFIRQHHSNIKILLSFRSEHIAPIKALIAAKGIVPTRDQEMYLCPLTEAGVREAISGISEDKLMSNHYQLHIEPGLVNQMTGDLVDPRRPDSHIAPLLQYQLHNLWKEASQARNADYEWITLTEKVYLTRRRTSLGELIEAELQKLSEKLPAWQTYIDNGLIWNLLCLYTTDLLTAREKDDAEVAADYLHISEFAELFAQLKNHCQLMIPCGKEERPATRLAHDALAPLVRERFNNSDAPGQRAARIIETKTREKRAGLNSEFSETDLLSVDEGEKGMPQIPREVAAQMEKDRQRYRKERENRFRLAYETALSDHEHLRYEEALNNLELAAAEGILPEKIEELLTQLPFVFRELNQSDGLEKCQLLAGEQLPPTDQKILEKRYFPTMLPVPGGSFKMGSEEGYADEKPVHTVHLSSFEMAETPVTCWQYGLYCLATRQDLPRDSGFGRGEKPVVNVNWYEATRYCNWLSERHGLQSVYEHKDKNTVIARWENNGYRLPTEAEWEYAAREGGKNVRFGNGKDIAHPDEMNYDYAHPYNDKSYISQTGQKGLGRTTPVFSFQPNALGFYDMSGNVYEWCWDRWSEGDYYRSSEGVKDPTGPENSSESGKLVRGGSWDETAMLCRCSYRFRVNPFLLNLNVGFRVVRR
ncbi:MAG: SUMF1/EgtB/PvdO family nonheme iron enzyme [Bacteroidia bacterium]